MKEKMQVVLMPRYVSEFCCIGSDCEELCCAVWNIDVDKKTYQKYRSLPAGKMKDLLNKHVKRNRRESGDSKYAKICLDKEGFCPLLSPEMLCQIQLELGEEYLSDVCALFPRMTNHVDGKIEKSLSLSCPEVARIVLSDPEIIVFDVKEEPQNNRPLIIGQLSTHDKRIKGIQYFWDLRIFMIQLLQNRKYPLAERIFILGTFYLHVQNKLDSGQQDEIPTLIQTYQGLIDKGDIIKSMKEIPVNTLFQLNLLKEIMDERLGFGMHMKYREYLEQWVKGMNYTGGEDQAENARYYREAYENYYRPFIQKHEHVLENYLVNYAYMSLTPFKHRIGVFNDYIFLVLHYALIKIHLVGIAAFHKGLNMDTAIRFIQAFSKNIEHDKLYLSHIHHLLQENGLNTLTHMAMLLKEEA